VKLPPQMTPLLEGHPFRMAREWYQALQAAISSIVGLSDGDKGDVTVSGDGANWSIDPGAVTYAKIQDVSGASKLLGRGDSGAGDVEEITLGAGLTMTGTTLSSSGGVADGDKGDITVSGSGATWTIDAGAVTYAKMQDVSAASKLLGRGDSGAGDPQEITLGSGLAMTGTTLSASGSLADADYGDITVSSSGTVWTIDNDAVSFAKMQNIATDRLIGRDTAGSGDPEEITVGGGVEFTTSGGIQRSALTGDVTAAAGNSATTIANDAVTYAKMQNVSATARVLGRKTAGAGDPEEMTLSETLDLVGSAAQGDILYRNATIWTRLGAGTAGQILKTGGAGANPSWINASAASAGLVLVANTTVAGSAVTSLDFTGLDLDTDFTYFIRYGLKNATASSNVIRLFHNGDTTTSNYTRSALVITTTTTINRSNLANFIDIPASSYCSGFGYVFKPADADVVRAYSNYNEAATTSTAGVQIWHTWTSANNPTQMTFTGDQANGLAIGSFMQIWKMVP